jgi:hypothetical protein
MTNTPTRACRIHGIQSLDEGFRRYKAYTYKGRDVYTYKCIQCDKDARAARYAADPKASQEKTRQFKLANPDKASAYNAKYYAENKEDVLAQMKDRREDIRVRVYGVYSGGIPKCFLCEELKLRFLCLDHITGGGNIHREFLGRKTERYLLWLEKSGFPPGYRVLCHNCNGKESLRLQRKAFENKIWDETNSFKTRIIEGVPYPVDLKKMALAKYAYDCKIKMECLVHYSAPIPSCACCAVKDTDVLAIDHIHGGGNDHRKEIDKRGNVFQKWLIKNKFPTGYRVLCHNCNFSYGAYGNCPHQSV